jgi:predicted permease
MGALATFRAFGRAPSFSALCERRQHNKKMNWLIFTLGLLIGFVVGVFVNFWLYQIVVRRSVEGAFDAFNNAQKTKKELMAGAKIADALFKASKSKTIQ